MSQKPSDQLRTVALVGHGAAGKTTLAESLLAACGAIKSRGSVEKGNTVCDFDPIEKEMGHSLQASLVSFDWGDTQVHLIDTPGYPDFAGQADFTKHHGIFLHLHTFSSTGDSHTNG